MVQFGVIEAGLLVLGDRKNAMKVSQALWVLSNIN